MWDFWRSSDLRLCPCTTGGMGSSKPSGMTKKKRKECCLQGAVLLVLESVALYGWAGISANGQVWLRLNWDTQCTVEGREEAKRAERVCFNFSCLATKHEFLFSHSMTIVFYLKWIYYNFVSENMNFMFTLYDGSILS